MCRRTLSAPARFSFRISHARIGAISAVNQPYLRYPASFSTGKRTMVAIEPPFIFLVKPIRSTNGCKAAEA
jgi:hypothetical protein